MTRAEKLALARSWAENWGRWCLWRGEYGSPLGRPPRIVCGGMDRRYRPPPQWYPPNPRPPEPNDPMGYETQIAYTRLPKLARRVLRVEFMRRPTLIRPEGYEGMVTAAILAGLSPRKYPATLENALLMLFNVIEEKHGKDRLLGPGIARHLAKAGV